MFVLRLFFVHSNCILGFAAVDKAFVHCKGK